MPVVLITGGARGIGAAIATRLQHNGWDVVIADRDPAPIGRSVVCDVSDEAAVTSLIAGIATTEGRLDALICNAGFGIRKPVEQLSLAEWSTVLATNLTSIFLVVRAAPCHCCARRTGPSLPLPPPVPICRSRTRRPTLPPKAVSWH